MRRQPLLVLAENEAARSWMPFSADSPSILTMTRLNFSTRTTTSTAGIRPVGVHFSLASSRAVRPETEESGVTDQKKR